MSLLSALRRVFQRPAYVSDVQVFVQELKKQDPTLEARQQAGRNIQWLAKTDRASRADLNAGRVRQKAYPYQAEGK